MNRTADLATVPTPLSDLTATGVVAAATWRELARRHRLVSLGFLLMLPVLLLVAVRLWYPGEVPAGVLLPLLAGEVYIRFLLPVTAMALGAPAISEPVSEGTLVYFWTRPIRRHALYLGRILAAAVVASSLVLLSQAAVFGVVAFGWGGELTLSLVRLHVEMTVVTLLGTVAYTALFGAFGAVLKRPMLAAILVTFGWESAVASIPQRIQEFTLRFHLSNLVEWPSDTAAADIRGIIGSLLNQALAREPVPRVESVAVLLGVTVVSTVAGVLLLRRQQLDRQG